MADGYDRFDNEGSGGGSFVMGLLTGTVLGAGLGMLFAPKTGSELRNQVAEQASHLANTASEGYRRASENAGTWAEKGREMYDKARDAVARGTDEAQKKVRDTAGSMTGSGVGTTSGAGGFGAGESIRGGSTESIRGGSTTPGSTIPGGTGGTGTRRS
jgi:gas vesicle protein